MDLIYTDSQRIDVGVLSAYKFDLSFGASENDFSVTVESSETALEFGSLLYLEGTEYGGIVDAVKAKSNSDEVTYTGRTWHGVLNSKVIQPDPGKDYYVVSGDANDILSDLISRLGLTNLFQADKANSGVVVKNYQFHRYCKGYDGIQAMLNEYGAKLLIEWKNKTATLTVKPISDYSEVPMDEELATLTVEQHNAKVNHLICLGQGDLAERQVVHLYANQNGDIVDTQYYTGIKEVADTYDYSSVESLDELKKGGIERLKELRNTDKADIALQETDEMTFDIGDIVCAYDVHTGISVAAAVTQKIVKITNDVVCTEYKTGG